MRFGRHDNHLGPDVNAAVEIDDILIDHANTAARNAAADRRGLVGTVDAIDGVA
jgi:hypothetical protein